MQDCGRLAAACERGVGPRAFHGQTRRERQLAARETASGGGRRLLL